MRFNSVVFIFGFAPLCWSGWRLLAWSGRRQLAIAWLCLASLGFYAYWNWHYAPLLALSLIVNFLLGRRLIARRKKFFLWLGLVWNLGLLVYFKYLDFFIANLDAVSGRDWPLRHVILPLGISFFTFQKIAFLVDAWRGKVSEINFLDFCLFVLFFPQLIAGPIVHHQDFIPQLRGQDLWRFDPRRFLLGALLFSFGLFNKTVIADTLAPVADSAFGLAASGVHLRFFEAWCGVVAYGFQLFYDFSGYSTMALGLGLLFGFKLPVNFFAPYTSLSIIEFWRRWHVTLSAFLRDYVYIPLGGNRRGLRRQMCNLFLTMMLAGIWHGAGWTFLVWGIWHGVFLVINHLWHRRRTSTTDPLWAALLTFIVVQGGWSWFRAPNLRAAATLIQGLIGVHGVSVPLILTSWVDALAPTVRPEGWFPNIYSSPSALLVLAGCAWAALRGPPLLAWLGMTRNDVAAAPAEMQTEFAREPLGPGPLRIAIGATVFALSLAALSRSSPFLYFQF